MRSNIVTAVRDGESEDSGVSYAALFHSPVLVTPSRSLCVSLSRWS